MQSFSRRLLAGSLGWLATGAIVCAQESDGPRLLAKKLADESGAVMMQGAIAGTIGGNVQFIASEMSFDGQVVKGSPYSAEAVTETTQTLSDGNRIHRTVTASVYRDGEGRTRREQTMAAIGPLAPPGDAPQTIFISDPVANMRYVLQPATKTARKLPSPPVPSAEAKLQMEKVFAKEKAAFSAAAPGLTTAAVVAPNVTVMRDEALASAGVSLAMPLVGTRSASSSVNSKVESLGTQVMEGVQAEGTRTTFTIPAGQIGNDQPINIVSERWFSPDLRTVVMTRHSDPRMGETVYRLTNVSRSEPSPTLFQVPPDYTISDQAPGFMPFFTKPTAPETK